MPFVAPASDKKATPQRGFVAPHQDHASGLSLSDLITGQRHVSTPMDMLRGGYRGLQEGVRGLADLGAALNPQAGQAMKLSDALYEGLRAKHPAVAEALHPQYQPQTKAGQYTRTLAAFLPNAALGGEGFVARGAQVVAPALLSETAGQFTKGTPFEGTARLLGAVAGGGAAGWRPGAASAPTSLNNIQQSALRKFNAQAPQNVPGMIQSAAERLRNGMNPTLVDVTDEAGRGVIRSAASRMTPARTAVQQFADDRAVALPRRMSAQARQHLSSEPRTPQEIASDLSKARSTQADAQYGAVENDQFQMTPEAVQALRTNHGQGAISAAIDGERDPNVRAALARLRDDIHDNPATPITVGMADSISKALLGSGRASADANLGSILTGLGRDVRNAARDASPGYGAAVDNYSEASGLIDAAGQGERYLNPRTTDTFVSDMAGASPEAIQLARATARRNVEVASGENVSAAPGVARRIFTAPEVQARTRAMLPEDQAQAFERAMQLEHEAVQDARYVAPNTGSPTQGRLQDAAQTAGEGMAVVGQAAAGHHVGAALSAAKLFLKRQGLNDAEAEALANLSIDPANAPHVTQYLQSRIGPSQTQQFLTRAAPLLLTSGAVAAEPAQ